MCPSSAPIYRPVLRPAQTTTDFLAVPFALVDQLRVLPRSCLEILPLLTHPPVGFHNVLAWPRRRGSRQNAGLPGGDTKRQRRHARLRSAGGSRRCVGPPRTWWLMRMSAGSRGIFCPSEIGTTLQLLRYENSSGTDETGAYRASGMPKQNFAPLNVATSSGLVEYVEWPCKIGCIITSYVRETQASMR